MVDVELGPATEPDLLLGNISGRITGDALKAVNSG